MLEFIGLVGVGLAVGVFGIHMPVVGVILGAVAWGFLR